jgi:hypothetical protein
VLNSRSRADTIKKLRKELCGESSVFCTNFQFFDSLSRSPWLRARFHCLANQPSKQETSQGSFNIVTTRTIEDRSEEPRIRRSTSTNQLFFNPPCTQTGMEHEMHDSPQDNYEWSAITPYTPVTIEPCTTTSHDDGQGKPGMFHLLNCGHVVAIDSEDTDCGINCQSAIDWDVSPVSETTQTTTPYDLL